MQNGRLLLIFFLCLTSTLALRAQTADERVFIFGHSLLDHRPPLIATPSDETTVPHWLYLLAQADGNALHAGGKYGFLPQHANDPPFSQWGYDIVPGVWDSDQETFAQANVSTVILTAGNFIQWQGPDQEYPGDPGVTPINATEDVFDWVRGQSAQTCLIIYENWPDMAPFLSGETLQTEAEFTAYNNYLRGDFHDWWIEYHDALLASRPAYEVKMVPVGPILADILESDWADEVPYDQLYEDNAPHGRPTLYFLASVITYAAVYQKAPPAGFDPGSTVNQQIRDNYDAIAGFIMTSLNDFNDANGISRVFYDNSLPVVLNSFTATAEDETVVLDWASSAESGLNFYEVQRQRTDESFVPLGSLEATGSGSTYRYTDTAPLAGVNSYRLRMVNADGSDIFSDAISVDFGTTSTIEVIPSGPGYFSLRGLPDGGHYRLLTTGGSVMMQGAIGPGQPLLSLQGNFPEAVYFLEVSTSPTQRTVVQVLLR